MGVPIIRILLSRLLYQGPDFKVYMGVSENRGGVPYFGVLIVRILLFRVWGLGFRGVPKIGDPDIVP